MNKYCDNKNIQVNKKEKDLVLQITKKLKREFKSEGYRVYLTRNRDRF